MKKVLLLVLLLFFVPTSFCLAGSSPIRVILLPVVSESVEQKITNSTISALRTVFQDYEGKFELKYAPHGYKFGSRFDFELVDLDTRDYLSLWGLDLDKVIAATKQLSGDAVLLFRFRNDSVTNWPEDIFMTLNAYMVDIKGRQSFHVRAGVDGTFNDDGEGDIKSISEKLFYQYQEGVKRPRPAAPVKAVAKPKPQKAASKPAPVKAQKEKRSEKCSTDQILQMKNMGLTDSQIRAACN